MGGGRLRRPPLINYQFYIKKIIKIYRKTHKKYLKISKNIQTKTELKFRNKVQQLIQLEFFNTFGKCRTPRFTRKFSNGSKVATFGLVLKYLWKSNNKSIKTPLKRQLFFIDFSSGNPPKIHPKTSPKPLKNQSKNQSIF